MAMNVKSTVTGLAVLLALAGCQKREPESVEPTNDVAAPVTDSTAQSAASGATVTAQLNPTQGNQTAGTVTFTPGADGVRVVVDLNGLTPGPHGMHVHEFGDCSAPDASSAGNHFNPKNMPHGAPDSPQRHAGDFGNLVADESGKAHYEFVDMHFALEGPDSIVGKALVVHAQPDDMKTQPSGNSGARIACGVIGADSTRTAPQLQ